MLPPVGGGGGQTVSNEGVGRNRLSLETLRRRLLHVGNEIPSIVLFLQTGEYHFRARDVFFRVFQVSKQRLLSPSDTCQSRTEDGRFQLNAVLKWAANGKKSNTEHNHVGFPINYVIGEIICLRLHECHQSITVSDATTANNNN